MRHAICALAVGLALAACSKPDLSGTSFSCTSNVDCLGGKVCRLSAGVDGGAPTGVCVSMGDLPPITVGMSAPFQGASQGLGIELRRGIQAVFQDANDEGGVNGRMLELVSMNDNYDPDTALAHVKTMLDIQQEVADPDMPDVRGPNSVLALIGNVGTPTMLVTAPLANKNHVVFFAPFTGATTYLRDGTNSPYVFNYRAGYAEETQAMVEYMMKTRNPPIITDATTSYKHIMAFTQNDSYGDSGYNGFVSAYRAVTGVALPQPDSKMPNPSIFRAASYTREMVDTVDGSIADAETFLTGVLPDAPAGGKVSVGVFMIDTYQPGNKFIRAIKDWINADAGRASKLDVLFIHVSFVGSDALAQTLTTAPSTYTDVVDGTTKRSYADGVMVTQVVPYYQSQAAGITTYRSDMSKFDGLADTFTSLEGYIAAKLFVAGLKAAGPDPSDDALVAALNDLNGAASVDLGIGTILSFTSVNHQASHTVWGTTIGADGKFTVPFMWDPSNGIHGL